MAEVSTTIAIDDDPNIIFNAPEWIGTGQTYPAADTPSYILAARAALLAIPTANLLYLPHTKMSILDFLQAPLPAQPSVLVQEKAKKNFSMLEPNEDITCLRYRKIPPTEWIQALNTAFGQAWFDGAKSLVDWRYGKDSRLPLWIITYWTEMSIVHKKRRLWLKAHQWVTHMSGHHKTPCLLEADNVVEKMATLGWGATLRGVGRGLGVETLVPLLSDDWLDDDIINLAMHHLTERMHLFPTISKSTIIAPLSFSANLVAATNNLNVNTVSFRFLQHYTAIFKNGQRTILYFPAHINNNHWIVFCIDFIQKSLRYGDSLSHCSSKPTNMIRATQNWLKSEFGSPFRDEGDTLTHGVQTDSFSCGICVVNTLAHNLFGDQLFTHAKRFSLRMMLFVELAETQISLQSTDEPSQSKPPQNQATKDTLVVPDYSLLTPASRGVETIDDVPQGSVTPPESQLSRCPTPNTQTDEDIIMEPLIKPAPNTQTENEKRRRSSSAGQPNAPTKAIAKKPKRDVGGESCGPTGISRSATAEQKLKAAMRDGSLQINEAKQKNYEYTCQLHDWNAKFRYGDEGWQVQHSGCGKWYRQKAPYDTSRFVSHVRQCQAKGRATSITDWLKKAPTSQAVVKKPMKTNKPSNDIQLPCLGITPEVAPLLPDYLLRTPAQGGGARLPHKIAFEVYGITYAHLNNAQKKHVDTLLRHEQTWFNDRVLGRVYATDCQKTVAQSPGNKQMCTSCSLVLSSKNFKTALRKPLPAPENLIFLNKKYLNESLAHIYAKTKGLQALFEEKNPKHSVSVRYAIGVLQGKYKDSSVFTGMVEATVHAHERRERGVGLQNFTYTPSYEEFAHMCAITSPATYRLLSESFQLPTQRNLQLKRSQIPRFPTDISERSFVLAEEYIKKLNYQGPLGLSCDDTKLHPAFRTYWDAEKKCHLLIGGTDEPRVVADPSELEAILREAKDTKATKIRLWCLQIALPKMPPLIVAAKAIPNDLNAKQLTPLSLKLIVGLLERDIIVVSYACDGTQIERVVQQMIVDSAPYIATYIIHHPCPGRPDIVLKFPMFNGHPVIMIQDSKHALKTARNNLFTGARVLTLGNDVAIYSQAWDLAFAFNGTGPLYHRDVEKLDRQDDNAATRLFSANTLEYTARQYPDRIGFIVYLFIFGELVDAYQNRKIGHGERINMALRARFFLEIWQLFIKAAGYAENRHYISRESNDIMRILADGLLSLIIVYRDHMGGKCYPLLPWLHSSEVCEHVFAECRKLVKDFTYLDFLYMVPRLSLLIRTAVNFCHSADPRARASGYAHTYFDSKDCDLATLSKFPTDDEIIALTQSAYDEAHSLFSLLGVSPNDFLSPAPPVHQSATRLPGINSWFSEGQDPCDESHYASAPGASDILQTDDESEPESSSESDIEDSDATILQGLIEDEEKYGVRATQVDERMLSLTCAAIAVNVEECAKVRDFPGPSADEEAQQIEEDVLHISNALRATRLPQPNIDACVAHPADRSPSFYINLDFTRLVELRRMHETRRSAVSTRTITGSIPVAAASDGSEVIEKANKETIHQQIIRAMREVLRKQDADQVSGVAGLERLSRWKAGNGDVALTGNSMNAALAAGQRAVNVIKRRQRAFSPLPQLKELTDGLVGRSSPCHDLLRTGNYGIILVGQKLHVGRVLAIYSQGGGKAAGPHSWQSEVNSIGSVSYLAMQVYEYAFHHKFRAIHPQIAFLQAFTFTHLPSDQFLMRLHGSVSLSPDSRILDIGEASFAIYAGLRSRLPSLLVAVKSITEARRKSGKGIFDDTENL
ncbi:hypothetical protein BJ138DRAFT_1130617 [Hygrophoropsis aurantiaca]|uniref:Uncharacterized protein n=1 Tax=Hygrophoropsis aurantiaca TaxID=72124 RepID=A0ACB7ZWS2_9AGAM|nr:hypothetical protein BJ138DRAFT_1130617 [Hygrophoropsis aurantiaca]